MVIKGELFSQQFIPKLIDGSKTRTSRPITGKYSDSVFELYNGELCEASPEVRPVKLDSGLTRHRVRHYVPCKPKYQPGDIMYVWETYCPNYFDCFIETGWANRNGYKADWDAEKLKSEIPEPKWVPSIHMPREAARLWLRVTDVKVQNLKDVTNDDAEQDGFITDAVICTAPNGANDYTGLYAYDRFMEFWRKQYGADVNWMWVYYLEKISREEALKDEN